MESGGRRPLRVCFVCSDETVVDWVRAAFERTEPDVSLSIEETFDAAIDRIADAQQLIDPRMRSPLVDDEPMFDCVVCGASDAADGDPITFVEQVRNISGDLPVVLFVESGSESLASDAISAGITDYLTHDGDDPAGALARRVVDLGQTYRAERRATRQRKRAQRIVEHHPEIVTVARPGAAIVYQNDTVEDVLGYAPEELTGPVPFDRVHPDDWQRLREAFYDAVIDPDSVPTVEFRVRDDDGEWRTLEARGRNLMNDPLVHGFVVSTRDVTERKEYERELEGYRRVIENVGDPIYVLDRQGFIEWVNDAFLEQSGYDRDFIEGSHVSTYMRQGDFEEGAQLVQDLLDDDERDWGRFEFVAENVDGDIRHVENNVAVITDEEGSLRGTVGVLHEISDPD